jgi:hypothetical protein
MGNQFQMKADRATDIQNPPKQLSPRPKRQKRSLGLALLVLGLLVVSGYGWLRFEQAVLYWDLIANLDLPVGSIYFALAGFAWGAGGLVLAVALWFRRDWAPRWTRIGMAVIAASYWIERLWLYRSAESRYNLVFALVLSAFALGLGFLILALPAQKRFFAPPGLPEENKVPVK